LGLSRHPLSAKCGLSGSDKALSSSSLSFADIKTPGGKFVNNFSYKK